MNPRESVQRLAGGGTQAGDVCQRRGATVKAERAAEDEEGVELGRGAESRAGLEETSPAAAPAPASCRRRPAAECESFEPAARTGSEETSPAAAVAPAPATPSVLEKRLGIEWTMRFASLSSERLGA